MSLLDAFLRDAWQQPVVRSDVYFADRTDSAVGLGSHDDPYNGNDSKVPGNFDAKLNSVPANTTIRIGPGTFKTKGTTGWAPKSGQRVVGAGVNETTLLVAAAPTGNTAAIGNPDSPPALDGFEASDLTINCDFGNNPNATSIGGIAVNGTHVAIRRGRVLGFGSRSSSTVCRVIAAARSADTALATDCVIEGCIVDSPYIPPPDPPATVGPVTCLHLGKTTDADDYYHKACGIRNCFVDCGAANLGNKFVGIEASGGGGTVVEENRIINCHYGGPYQDGTNIPTKDLVVRGNYYYNVRYGIYLSVPSSISPIGRVVLLENEVELDTTGTLEGLRIHGANT
ncbi:MAG: hypothetical protein HYY24_21000, partial [Verrucomicrobia bacterium]|nr:hypothetical protein [Verrucomicrobiota bacterium]